MTAASGCSPARGGTSSSPGTRPARGGRGPRTRSIPIKSDCRSARPAGRVLSVGGRLLRPAQRCERRYGESLVWLEIKTLTPDAFAETEVAEWRVGQSSGPHTADLTGPIQAIDYRLETISRK